MSRKGKNRSFLKKRDIRKVAVVVTSSKANFYDIRRTMRNLESKGIEVLLSPLTKKILDNKVKRGNYVAPYSTAKERFNDLVWAVEREPDIIISLAGGVGSAELIPFLSKASCDFEKIGIPLVGFSDVTTLLNAWAFLGNPAFLGPCFENSDEVWNAIKKISSKDEFEFQFKEKVNFDGEVKRKGVWGGNLSCFLSFFFSDFEICDETPQVLRSFEYAFVFEDIFEKSDWGKKGGEFSLDWSVEMLMLSRISEKLTLWGDVKGIPYRKVKKIVLSKVQGPAVFGLRFGHDITSDPLPIGWDVDVIIKIRKAKFKARWEVA